MKISIPYNNNTTRVFTSGQKLIVGETATLVLSQVPAILNDAVATIQINSTNVLPAFTGQDGNQNTGDITQVLTVVNNKAEVILSSEQTSALAINTSYTIIIFLHGYRTNESGEVVAQAGGVLYHSITRIGTIAGSVASTPAQAFSLDFKTINGENIIGTGDITLSSVESVNGQTGVVVLDQDNILDGATFKQYSQTEKTKLAGIQDGATANQTDSYLLDRANHTGTQAISTVTGLQLALDDKANITSLATVAGTGDYDDLLNKPTIPTATSELSNDSGFITITPVNEREYKKTLVVGSSNADYITDGTDDQVQIQQAINALTAGRDWIETVVIKGDVTVSDQVFVPSYTRIKVIGKVNKTSGFQTTPIAPKGYFRVGTDNTVVDYVEIVGNFEGTCFSSFPTLNSGENDALSGVFSNAVVRNSNFDINFKNIGCPIRLNNQGHINGTPGENCTITTKGVDCVVGAELYCNGFLMRNCHIIRADIQNCLDDMAAIVGHWGGQVGGTGTVQNCSIETITGSRNADGSRGGGCAKLDAGSTAIGKGQLIDVAVYDVNVRSSTGTGEGGVAVFNAGNSKNIFIGNVQATGLDYAIYYQGNGEELTIDNVQSNCKYDIILQSSRIPDGSQSIKINNLTGDSKGGSTTEHQGIVFCAGSAGQGFSNVKIRADIRNKTIPVNEGSTTLPTDITGSVVGATLSNFEYNLDTRNRDITDCVFSATNSLKRIYRNGLFISDDLDVQNVKLTGDQTIAGVKTLSSIPVLPSSNPTTSNQAVRKGYIDDSLIDTNTLIRQYNTRATTAGVTPTAYNKSVLNRHLDDSTIWSRQQPNYFLSAKSSAFSALTSSLIASGTNNLNSAFTGSTGSFATMTTTDATAGLVFDQPATLGGTHGIDTGYSPNGFDAGFTASIWFKPANTSGVKRLISWNTAPEARIDFLINGSNLIGRACQTIAIYIGRQVFGAIDTTWQKLTVTYDGSGLAAGVKLYRNGVAVDIADSNAGTFTGIPSTSTDNIPILSYANNAQTNPATGQADLIEIISGVSRTANEELQLFNLQKGRFGI